MIKMKRQVDPAHPAISRVFICDSCGREIDHNDRACLLRGHATGNDDPAVYHVHEHCIQSFSRRRGGLWDQFSLPSAEASWFIPVVIGDPTQIEILREPGHGHRSISCN